VSYPVEIDVSIARVVSSNPSREALVQINGVHVPIAESLATRFYRADGILVKNELPPVATNTHNWTVAYTRFAWVALVVALYLAWSVLS
jgi:hypothetical protein